jgi:predicted ATPase
VEDLQWGDYSTLDVLTALARRRAVAKLLVIGTYRPTEVLLTGHPLLPIVQELRTHGEGADLMVEGLNAAGIEAYLGARFAQSVLPTLLVQVLQQRTGGNPLFLINLIEDLIVQGLLVRAEGGWALQGGTAALTSRIPESSRQVLEKQGARLDVQEQQVLAAASIAGAEFSAAAVAAALGTVVNEVEVRCEALARQQQFLQRAGLSEWPDGTVAARYRFRHALYQQLWHERVTPTQGLLWHRRIGECIENAYGNRVREVSTELAMHFERAREYQRAVRFLQLAGEKAIAQCAYREAAGLLIRATDLLHALPDSLERIQQELTLRVSLSEPLVALHGFAAPEVERSYVQARDLCAQIGDTPQLFPVLQGLASLYVTRAEFPKARELQEQLLREAEKAQAPELLVRAHRAMAVTLVALGEFAAARTHLGQSLALQSIRQQPAGRLLDDYAQIATVAYEALVLGILGYPDQARQRSTEALTWARQSRQPFFHSATCIQTALLSICLREARLTQQLAEEGLVIARRENLSQLVALGTFYRGWGLAARGQIREGVAQMRQGLAALQSIKATWYQSYFLALIAEACGQGGNVEEARSMLCEASARCDSTGEHFAEAELYRVKGQLVLQPGARSPESALTNPQPSTPNPQDEAEACFLKAMTIARQQGAKLWELRAVMSLSRLWRQQGKKKKARQILVDVYGCFTEGFDTTDLQEARDLVEEFASPLPSKTQQPCQDYLAGLLINKRR